MGAAVWKIRVSALSDPAPTRTAAAITNPASNFRFRGCFLISLSALRVRTRKAAQHSDVDKKLQFPDRLEGRPPCRPIISAEAKGTGQRPSLQDYQRSSFSSPWYGQSSTRETN